jgi:hypothetical protein
VAKGSHSTWPEWAPRVCFVCREPATVVLDSREPEVIIRTVLTFDRAADDLLSDCHRRGFTERTIRTY